jgi:hypothetical protein
MAKLKNTYINGQLSISGIWNVTGHLKEIEIDIDDELLNICNSLEEQISILINPDEDISPNQ